MKVDLIQLFCFLYHKRLENDIFTQPFIKPGSSGGENSKRSHIVFFIFVNFEIEILKLEQKNWFWNPKTAGKNFLTAFLKSTPQKTLGAEKSEQKCLQINNEIVKHKNWKKFLNVFCRLHPKNITRVVNEQTFHNFSDLHLERISKE